MKSIYTQKLIWKVLLLIGASIIVAFSLWYTQRLVNKLKEDEKARINLWAEAIQKKAALVRFTTQIIAQTAEQEKLKAELYAQATRELMKDLSDYSFVVDVLKNNTTVPVILVDDKGKMSSRNLPDSTRERDSVYIRQQLEEMKSIHPPIEFEYFKGRKQWLYYKNSKLYEFTKEVFERNIKSFITDVAENSASVPVIMIKNDSTLNFKDRVLASGKIDNKILIDSVKLAAKLNLMSEHNEPIQVNLGDGACSIFYENSFLLQQLRYYPWVQFTAIGLFLLIAYFLFSTSRKAEQNQVWVGMSKETAHQLGTPLTALYGWIEYLKSTGTDENAIIEMQRDMDRLKIITDRFSKIGSQPALHPSDIVSAVSGILDYMRSRSSKNISIDFSSNCSSCEVKLSVPLFEWVIENLVRNSIDAMDGKGKISVRIDESFSEVIIDVSDTGKGIPKSKFKTIFKPGYTTKKRGWGLGLSLCKRIIELYHNGSIFVKSSSPESGTIFRIIMKK
ncbi:MAG: sensor histidine kinase [Bacteroidota bacterium]